MKTRKYKSAKAAKSRWDNEETKVHKQCQEKNPSNAFPTPTPTPTPTDKKTPYIPPCEQAEQFEKYWQTVTRNKRTKQQAARAWPDFLQFWDAHPNRTGKLRAWGAWLKHLPPIEEVLSALEWQCEDPERSKESYRYFKRPEAWINAASWEDAPPDKTQEIESTFGTLTEMEATDGNPAEIRPR